MLFKYLSILVMLSILQNTYYKTAMNRAMDRASFWEIIFRPVLLN